MIFSLILPILQARVGFLVAISIPIFTSQLEKAREATDMANIRAAYAEVSTEALTNTDSAVTPLYVTATQTQDKWKNNNDSTTTDIGGVQVGTAYNAKDVAKKVGLLNLTALIQR